MSQNRLRMILLSGWLCLSFMNLYFGTCINRPSLKRAKLEFKRQSCVFWVLLIYKNERKKLEFPEMGRSALTGGGPDPPRPLKSQN